MQSLEELFYATSSTLNWTSLFYQNLTSQNNTNVTDLQSGNQFILPWWRQMIWTVLFAGMIAVATGGNLIVIWIVMAHKRMRTVTNYFLVNLSIADAMVSTLNVTFNYTYMLNSHWPFGNLYCKISQFIAVLTICASVFTLMAISIDRYMAIMNPLKPRMGRRATLCIAIAIWIVGAILSLPMLLFYKTYTQNFVNGEVRVICYSDWPNISDDGLSYEEYLYNVIFMFLTYFLPIGSMTYTYARVGLELWGSQSIGEATQRQLDNIRSKRRVVKMMIVVVVIFAVCWLPFHVYFIVTSYLPEITNEPYIQELYLGIYWLAMSNSMYNPIIYCWMNSRFRRGFAQFFSWCPWVRVAPEPSLSRSEAVTSRYSCTGSPESHARISRNGTVRIPLHLQSTRGMAGNSRFPVHHRGHGKRWRTSQTRGHVS
ncbi:tachykinin-like peptides receptor 99D [Cephus cinctus]|uniref:Tachykinin-like peptides receptor 99D n=1 Tax=Cephus cinctus TaxID=211228 RepID=A0AAJ7BNH5_CEPCN|nr:tachykinin-like peptides receptor 99D [Cephus cinctus]XP_024939059.1 tachykinin-like peptides receptor 99D [Cephus cinctus]XP_024939064.1 tachykinin-like peptides receptor 99D [Cephus cinctus]XP_024939072.1 tachykinin-like peptides receptor 99D [Cephus cinctus]XP_024939082.1 tachykinin-like peptides receptor 99D [Cephus cinctus]XP_024939092.1 tachykinin-like peptides receptor 99D [Cephus cinctus]